MRSYMFEVAEMLGVRIGEYFDIDTKEGKFVFDNDGLYSMHAQAHCSDVLCQMLAGKLSIRCKPWKPELNQTYYSIDENGEALQDLWWGDYLDIAFYKLGNCYRTAEEAEAHADKWKTFYASDEILEV